MIHKVFKDINNKNKTKSKMGRIADRRFTQKRHIDGQKTY